MAGFLYLGITSTGMPRPSSITVTVRPCPCPRCTWRAACGRAPAPPAPGCPARCSWSCAPPSLLPLRFGKRDERDLPLRHLDLVLLDHLAALAAARRQLVRLDAQRDLLALAALQLDALLLVGRAEEGDHLVSGRHLDDGDAAPGAGQLVDLLPLADA